MVQIYQLTALSDTQFHDLCALLIDSVESGASMGFLAPITKQKAAAYWSGVAAEVSDGLVLLVAEEDGAIVGSVQVAPCARENGCHRADLKKLFVLRSHRGRGIASRLMRAAEEAAASLGLTLLILDTHEGSKAEPMYQHWGWRKVGVIPGYATGPDGTLHNTAFYYKDIAPRSEQGPA
ncbi:GNAT family N-acetyltransferase [Oceanidesulfovibrio marinus]|uniref:GNAT family N-acetyltransferase n=1 Tax=Oceanidesulfovibrio marinus TaxID=370038 RepID=A0ABX6NLX8_9BACT|nr:GNAT family N-acetyltransferase [Oceanidesulfovibrio marinus]QJT10625.1 GNAT family N-acetyltransferase [Oceanidesulfovibrio marinus]